MADPSLLTRLVDRMWHDFYGDDCDKGKPYEECAWRDRHSGDDLAATPTGQALAAVLEAAVAWHRDWDEPPSGHQQTEDLFAAADALLLLAGKPE